MGPENWRLAIAEERVAVVAVCLIVATGGLAVAVYGWGYETTVAFGIEGGMLAAAGLIIAGAILFADVLRDSAKSWVYVE